MEKILRKGLRKGSEKSPVSVLQADELFVKKILSRNSSVGNCSSRFDNFRTPAEVPFEWESEPGKPKDPPKGDFFCHPPVSPSDAEAGVAHAPPPPPPRAPRPAVYRQAKVRFWKKLIEKGQKAVKKVRPKPLLTAVRGAVVFGGFDGILPKSSDYYDYFSSSMASSSSNYSSSTSSSSNSHFALEASSKLQTFARGCIKWVF